MGEIPSLNFLAESRPGTSATRGFILYAGSKIATFALGLFSSKRGDERRLPVPKLDSAGRFFLASKNGDGSFLGRRRKSFRDSSDKESGSDV